MKRLTNKPLSEWTLREIKAECEKHECCTVECPAYRLENERRCRIKYPPNTWDLSEPLRWTEQDKEDARALKRLIPGANYVWRGSKSSPIRLYDRHYNYILSLNDRFAGLPLEETITLDEIIGDEE